MEAPPTPSAPASPNRHVIWGRSGLSPGSSSRDVSRAPSQTPSRPSSPLASAASSTTGDGLERPSSRRTTSKLQAFRRRPRYTRAKSSTHAPPVAESGVPLTAIARLARRTNNNLRMWRLRHSNGDSRYRTELDRLRELERGETLFAQQFTVMPSILVAASAMQTSEKDEKKVPVLLQQLSIRVTEETAKHYRNMLRIHLEYGGGFALIEWEIVRGYRDLLILRARLKADLHKHGHGLRGRKHKLPKLPRPRTYNQHKRHGLFVKPHPSADEIYDGIDEEEIAQSSDSEEENEMEGADANVQASCALTTDVSREPQSYAEAVEIWLEKILLIYMLRPDSNSLMQFFELSHLSMKLASEYSFHGKEGSLVVRSRASELGWHVNHLRPHDLKDMIERHTRKWVLVRDSYIAIVDNIYSTRLREVFEVDAHFKIKHIEDKKPENNSKSEGEKFEGDKSEGEKFVDAPDPSGAATQGSTPNMQAAGYVDGAANAGESDGLDGRYYAQALADISDEHKKKSSAKSVFLHLSNNARELKLAAGTERELRQWQVSIMQMKNRTPWAKKKRFDSFAPVRKNVFGQWFVDGRDYMWVLSEAMENARDTIFILDWWLSPELYLRRPAEGNQKWRLDRVLKRKAQQGVKIFVVVYRNVGPTIPIDSTWTKYSLLDLHENIHVIRSPNQLSNKSSLFWAHHEKLAVIDTTVAFNGGVDLCYGRWDTWQHVLTDDAPAAFLPKDPTAEEWSQRTQLFPGKDYSNARVKDFFELNKPYEDMYDRNNVPRMPWHDIHQMVVGQPARDLARHFVQRWNYVTRNKIPSRWTPLLLPPADFTKEDLDRLQLTGTCEYQVLRSSGDWSLGLREHEQSIQNAYIKLIDESEHLVYIENQFFITSTEVDGVLIENQIGNALVQRIVRAHEQNEPWKAFILIPLMPGFEAEVDTDKASSVRVICQCQFNSISRGPNSIFYRLESLGIRPDRYIHFFSLRKWGKFSNTPDAPNQGRIATELLYIHAKCMIVDDRIAIIGSANINERSQRGLRDSELAVCVRDTKVVESSMAGKPWKAGKFAHSLRIRLMREHLGVDIDKMEIIERLTDSLEQKARQARRAQESKSRRSSVPSEPSLPENVAEPSAEGGDGQFPAWLYPDLHTFNWYAGTSVNRGLRDHKKLSRDSRIQGNAEHHADVEGEGFDNGKAREHQAQSQETRYRAEQPDVEMENEARSIMNVLLRDRSIKSRKQFMRVFYAKFTKQDILRPVKRAADLPLPHTDEEGLKAVNNENIPIDPWSFSDPLNEQFVNDKWLAAAERNTLIYRLVFRCQPDDEVETWKDYKTYSAHLERFYEKQREDGGPDALRQSGHHEPERVDKHVLDGSIRKTNPEFLKWPDGLKPAIPAVQLPTMPNIPSIPNVQLPNMPWQAQQRAVVNTPDGPVVADPASATATLPQGAAPGGVPPDVAPPSAPASAASNSAVLNGAPTHAVPASPAPASHTPAAGRQAPSSIPGIAVYDGNEEIPSELNGHAHWHHHHKEHAPVGLPDEGATFGIPNGAATQMNGNAAPTEQSEGYFDAAPDGSDVGHQHHHHHHHHHHALEEHVHEKMRNKMHEHGLTSGSPSPRAGSSSPDGLRDGEGYFDASPGASGDTGQRHHHHAHELEERVHEKVKHSTHLQNMENMMSDMKLSGRGRGMTGEELDAGKEFTAGTEGTDAPLNPTQSTTSTRRRALTMSGAQNTQKPARRWGHFDHVLDAQVAEDMLQGITGHLVTFPTEWLNRELDSGNWNFQLDRIAPLEIYD